VCGKAKGTTGGEKLGQVIEVDERKMRAHLREVVRRTVEQTLNALLDAEDRRAGQSR
jgi:putative transposase